MSHLDQYGYVDENGNVWQKDCDYFKGRIIGRAEDHSPDETMAIFALRFEKLIQYYDELETEFKQNRNKKDLLDKIYRLLDYITEVDALGDFNQLLQKIHAMKDSIEADFDGNLCRKEAICQRIEELSQPEDWKSAGNEVKVIQEEFRGLGPVPEEKADYIWRRFREALDLFYENRRRFFVEKDQTRLKNLEKKEALCKRAEDLCFTDDWKDGAEELKLLQKQWKEIGPIPRDKTEDLWQRFNKACDVFFKRRSQHFQLLDEEKLNNLKRKEIMCEEAEALSESTEWKKNGELLKKLQEEWREIGPVPKDKDQEIWQRFKSANDRFFLRQNEFYKRLRKEQEKNLEEKERLCQEVEQMIVLKDFQSVREQVKEMQQAWKTIGPVPKREQSDALWERFKTACDKIFQK